MLSRMRVFAKRFGAGNAAAAHTARLWRVSRAVSAARATPMRRGLSTGAAPAPPSSTAAAARPAAEPQGKAFGDYFSQIEAATTPAADTKAATAAAADAEAAGGEGGEGGAPAAAAASPAPVPHRVFMDRDESVSAFVERCPPHSKSASYYCVLSTRKEHVRAFTTAEARPMERVIERIKKVRDSLSTQRDVNSLAQAVGVTIGKFVLRVPAGERATALWRRVASATHRGQLGLVSQVETQHLYDSAGVPLTEHRIYVFTHSMFDAADKQRVREALAKIAPDECGAAVKLPYRPDIYGYLGYDSPETTPQWVLHEAL